MSLVKPLPQAVAVLDEETLLQALTEVEWRNPDSCLVLKAVRDETGYIVDFTWAFANPAALAVRKMATEQLIGSRMVGTSTDSQLHRRLDEYRRVVETGSPCYLEENYPEGSESWFSISVTKFRDGVLLRPRDITLIKKTEEERDTLLAREYTARLEAEVLAHQSARELLAAQEKLVMTEKLAVAGQLAAGVGHEINNPLSFMMGNLHFVGEQLEALAGEVGAPVTERVREMVQALVEADRGAERIRTIVKDLRTFARADETRLGPVDVHAALDFSLSMAMPHIRHRAQVVRQYGQLPPVWGNEAKLGQVFLNLIVNAAQAIPEGAVMQHRIILSTRVEQGRAVVEVSDTGQGMSAEVMARIFEPFFTTKKPGEGTGLGLSICLSIIRTMQGELSVTSTPEQGSTFRVVLPLGEAPTVAPPAPAPVRPESAQRKRVLVIDDEPGITSAIRRILGRAHEVVITHSGREALEVLEKDERFDRIFCDLMMADMTGMDLYARLTERNASCLSRFVFMTGGSFTEQARTFLQQVSVPHVDKPFEPEHLRRLVAEVPPGSG